MEAHAEHEARCPDCGWPEADVYQVVSRHPTSTGMLLYTRCACGRLQVRALRVPGVGRPCGT
ncbi:hypothetical protein ACFPZ0_14875 [Streptomonospora nanhaiensis]|uniref:Uncharacterized protein n=1 Tax=Streptomonospora nanhaiensis TaxID=1323731 RepID=A0A853BVT4_9ACTN|nr:hypothetical protein [Streptomonospora nanhaiensis]MBV2365666.1 hypothetical protein [Streptomonospora nanhaiensis]MBX9388120.1 hypothetical protein [Streptomonospora nanhaiensis]NYI98896.1 hypothetical protein [Streptomonospora nanhaiensis]